MGADLDDFDIAILGCMRGNAKRPLRAMARDVGLHHNTLIQRVKRLEACGVIKGYVSGVDYAKAGFDLHVIIMLRIKRSGLEWKAEMESIGGMRELEAFYGVTGMWDAVSIWRVRDRDHLNGVLQKIVSNPSVIETTTHVVLRTYKEPYEFNPFAGAPPSPGSAHGTP